MGETYQQSRVSGIQYSRHQSSLTGSWQSKYKLLVLCGGCCSKQSLSVIISHVAGQWIEWEWPALDQLDCDIDWIFCSNLQGLGTQSKGLFVWETLIPLPSVQMKWPYIFFSKLVPCSSNCSSGCWRTCGADVGPCSCTNPQAAGSMGLCVSFALLSSSIGWSP